MGRVEQFDYVSTIKDPGNTGPVATDRAWGDPDPRLVAWIEQHQSDVLQSYAAQPLLVEEHGRQEDSYRTGGYATRQVLELAQNAADALRRSASPGRIEFRLTPHALYCANEGEPFDLKGLEAISYAYLSPKQSDEMGRFGLGFKSVLGITNRPQIFSRSISINFDEDLSRESLRATAPTASAFPILRWPMVADAAAEMKDDPVLDELGGWATTVVKLPLGIGTERLIKDLEEFPSEFLLFTTNVSELVITCDDPERPLSKSVTCESVDGTRRRIKGGGSSTEWMVWHRTHRPSNEALDEVGVAIRRDEVRVSYAVPLDDATSLGRFWASFPLQDVTSARGIHNAPWRVNDDRTSMLPGVFNDELLTVLAHLIVEAMPSLRSREDPARHFDYLPARGREAQYDADRFLTEIIPELARQVPCVPDGSGELRLPHELVLLNSDVRFEHSTYVVWSRRITDSSHAPHDTCYTTTTRRARLRSLVRSDERRPAENEIAADQWIEQLVPDATDAQCRAALEVVFSVDDETLRRDMRPARVIPDQDGKLHDLNQTRSVFIDGGLLSGAAGLRLMRSSFVDDELTVTRLKELGFTPVDPSVELRQLLRAADRKWTAKHWEAFWDLVLDVPTNVADEELAQHCAQGGEIRVRARSGKWVLPCAAILPGAADPVSADLAIDEDYHEDHRPQLTRLGTGPRPVMSPATLFDLTFMEYQRLRRDAYVASFQVAPRPTKDSCYFQSTEAFGPLYVLSRLRDTHDDAAAAAWTRELIEADVPAVARFGHPNTTRFPPVEVPAPHIWAASRYGLLDTCWGPREPAICLAPELTELAPLLPVATYPAATKIAGIKNLAQVTDSVWTEFIERVPTGGTPSGLGSLLASVAGRESLTEHLASTLPAMVAGDVAQVPAAEVLVAVNDEEDRILHSTGRPYIRVADAGEVELVCERFGCQPAAATLSVDYQMENPSEPIAALDRFGGLRRRAGGRLDGWTVVSCTDVYRVITSPEGTTQDSVEVAFIESDLGNQIAHLGELSDQDVLAHISAHFTLDLDEHGINKVLDDTKDQRVRLKLAQCRLASSVPEKLSVVLSTQALESKLPRGLLSVIRAATPDLRENHVAEILHDVHGYNVLIELKGLLADEGFDTPKTWAGSSGAVGFVRSLGMPVEYAGSSSATLGPELTVLGPPGLNPLHPYQEEIRDQIRQLLRSEPPERALLYLPTGAGKTRVTVESLAESICDGEITGPILWIAQTEELCEQAVQTWSTVWRQFGDRPLKVYRLWSSNNVGDSADDVSILVATDAKLGSIKDRDEYRWLPQRIHAIVIDEAHGAIATGITDTLRWLGIDTKSTARPMLGLTATPYRTSEEASQRLARRFGGNLIEVLGDDPYEALQTLGVLARVDHRELAGGRFTLDDSELPHYERFHDVPRSVLDRVGKDQARTQALVDDVAALPPEWPVLVFTASVLSAQIMSALLRLKDIEASSVSGATPMYERRRTIEDFREGRIRVLTNCNVLTEGFDAPAIRALYIARPTFSPNAYVQMVGRGLRGPQNGGKERCLVVNIADTFAQFGSSLAYKRFAYLWAKTRGEQS